MSRENNFINDFMKTFKHEGLTFDDVSLITQYSDFLPNESDISAQLTKNISQKIPFLSAAMDTVTEAPMAISMAMMGGIGVIHKNNSIDQQISEIIKVKKYESGMVVDPITIRDDSSLKNLISLKEKFNISGFPVNVLKIATRKATIKNPTHI